MYIYTIWILTWNIYFPFLIWVLFPSVLQLCVRIIQYYLTLNNYKNNNRKPNCKTNWNKFNCDQTPALLSHTIGSKPVSGSDHWKGPSLLVSTCTPDHYYKAKWNMITKFEIWLGATSVAVGIQGLCDCYAVMWKWHHSNQSRVVRMTNQLVSSTEKKIEGVHQEQQWSPKHCPGVPDTTVTRLLWQPSTMMFSEWFENCVRTDSTEPPIPQVLRLRRILWWLRISNIIVIFVSFW